MLSSFQPNRLHLPYTPPLLSPADRARHLRRGRGSIPQRCASAVAAAHRLLASRHRGAAAEPHASAQRARQGDGAQHAQTCFHVRRGCRRQAPRGNPACSKRIASKASLEPSPQGDAKHNRGNRAQNVTRLSTETPPPGRLPARSQWKFDFSGVRIRFGQEM